MIIEQVQTEIDVIKKEYDDAKELVLKALQTSEHSRNNDNTLLFSVWEMQVGKKTFDVFDSRTLIAAETIIRQRRKIQNEENKFLPTDPRVLHNRGIKEAVIRDYFSKQPNLINRYVEIAYAVM